MTNGNSWFTARFMLARQKMLRPIKWGVRRAIRPFWKPYQARIKQIVVEATREIIREEMGSERARIKQIVVEAMREEMGSHGMGGIAWQGVRTADLQMESLFSLIKLNRQLESEIAALSKR